MGLDRDARGRGQGRDGRDLDADVQDPRLRRERGVPLDGRRGLRLLPELHRPARDVRHRHQRADRAVAAARRPRDAVGAGARRVHHRAAQRVRQPEPRRRQLAPAHLRRPHGARRALHAPGHRAVRRRAARPPPAPGRGRDRRRPPRGPARHARARGGAGRPRRAGRPPAARGQGPREALRRPAGGRRLLVRRPRGLDHRAHRSERLGQDDGLQPHRRHDAPERGRGLVRRPAHRRDAAVAARAPRPRPHVPDHAPLP